LTYVQVKKVGKKLRIVDMGKSVENLQRVLNALGRKIVISTDG